LSRNHDRDFAFQPMRNGLDQAYTVISLTSLCIFLCLCVWHSTTSSGFLWTHWGSLQRSSRPSLPN